MMKTYILLLILALPLVSLGQRPEPIDMSQTVAYLQSKLPSTMQMELKHKKGRLVISTMKNGAPYRVDAILMPDVDYANISYNEEEGAVMVRCKKGYQCCDREFKTKKQRDQYGRMKFDIDPVHQAGFIKAMQHLAKLFQIPNYQNGEPFE